MRELLLKSPAATRKLGRLLGAALEPGDFIALTGELGAGKTALVKAVAEGARISGDASSPTFALVNVYRGGRVVLQHLDLYRLSGPAELFALGFDDLLAEPAATVCEWADKAGRALPAHRLQIPPQQASPPSRPAPLSPAGPPRQRPPQA